MTTAAEIQRIDDDEAIRRINNFLEAADLDDLATILSQFCENGPIAVTDDSGESDVFEDGKRVQTTPFRITAQSYSDDRNVDVRYDAFDWFRQASAEDIYALAECGWGGDYPADAIAQFFAEKLDGVAAIFAHIENVSDTRNSVGHETHVDATEALTWLDANRPDVAEAIRRNENIDTTKRL